MSRTVFLNFFTILVMLLAASAGAAETHVWLAPIELVGLDADLEVTVRSAIDNELSELGAIGVEAEPACPTQACRAQAIASASASAGLALTVVRGEPVVQVSAVIFDKTGLEVAREDRVISEDELSPKAHLLTDESSARLGALIGFKPPPPVDPEQPKEPTTSPTLTQPPEDTSENAPSAVEASNESGLPVATVTGYSLITLGAIGAVAGIGAIVGAALAWTQPSSSAAVKDLANPIGGAGLGVAIVSALLVGGGVTVLVLGMGEGDDE